MVGTPEDYVRISFIDGDDNEVVAGEIPKNVTEIDADYLGRMLQSAYQRGRRDQHEEDVSEVERSLSRIRDRAYRRGPNA